MTATSPITNAIQASQVTPSAPAAPTSSVTDNSNSVSTKPLTQESSSSISPRIVDDPTAGVIIQFLSSNGQLQSQIPSTTVVAYLKAGLTPDGLQKPQPDQPHKTNA